MRNSRPQASRSSTPNSMTTSTTLVFQWVQTLLQIFGKVNTELTDTEQLLNNSFNIVTDGLTERDSEG